MATDADTHTKTRSDLHDIADYGPLILDKPLSKEEFIALSARFPELRMEREKSGKITIMSPVKFGSGTRESRVHIYLGAWWLKAQLGEVFSASTGIELPDGAIKSPDCGWISPERLAQVSDKEEFLSVMPDFVAEVRSQTDSLEKLKTKMEEAWMKNGVRLGWLIDPYEEKAYVYRAGQEVEVVEGFAGKTLSGEEVMPGMELPLEELRIATA